jgi:ribose-phosphate pyrophosphokinase
LKNAGFKEIVVTNTIPIVGNKRMDNMKVLSIAPLFGEAIRRIHNGESVSSLFI